MWVLRDVSMHQNEGYWVSDYTHQGEIYSAATRDIKKAKKFKRKPKARYNNTGSFEPIEIETDSTIEAIKRHEANKKYIALGKAVEQALDKNQFYMKEIGRLKTGVVIESTSELLEWAKSEGE